MKPLIRIHNSQTNKVIDREMTDDEFAIYKADKEKAMAAEVEAESKAIAKAALLEKLGITDEEAKLLFS